MGKLKKEFILGGLLKDKVLGVTCPEKGIKLRPCNYGVIKKMMVEHHYSHTVPVNSMLSLGVFWYDKLSGGVMLGYGVNPKKAKEPGTYEFDRMWLSDEMPKYSETIVLSLFHKYLKATHPQVKKIISYADQSAGNNGTIYKAANYRYVGKIPCRHYILPDGTRIHPVTFWHRHGTERKEVINKLYPGIRRFNGKKENLYQLKYEYEL